MTLLIKTFTSPQLFDIHIVNATDAHNSVPIVDNRHVGGFPGGGRGRNLLPDEMDRERGSSPSQSDLEPRSDKSLSLGKALGRLSQERDGQGEWVGEPGTGLLQR